jgi:hypothetical protein
MAKPLPTFPNVLSWMYNSLERASCPFRRILERERINISAREPARAVAQA